MALPTDVDHQDCKEQLNGTKPPNNHVLSDHSRPQMNDKLSSFVEEHMRGEKSTKLPNMSTMMQVRLTNIFHLKIKSFLK